MLCSSLGSVALCIHRREVKAIPGALNPSCNPATQPKRCRHDTLSNPGSVYPYTRRSPTRRDDTTHLKATRDWAHRTRICTLHGSLSLSLLPRASAARGKVTRTLTSTRTSSPPLLLLVSLLVSLLVLVAFYTMTLRLFHVRQAKHHRTIAITTLAAQPHAHAAKHAYPEHSPSSRPAPAREYPAL